MNSDVICGSSTHSVLATKEPRGCYQSPDDRRRKENLRLPSRPLRGRIDECSIEVGSLGVQHLHESEVIDNAAQHRSQQLAGERVFWIDVQVVTELLIREKCERLRHGHVTRAFEEDVGEGFPGK